MPPTALRYALRHTILDAPQQICSQYRAQQRTAVAKRENHFVQMLHLQPVVECKPKTVGPMKQRQRAHDKQIKPCERRVHQCHQMLVAWLGKPAQGKRQSKQEELNRDQGCSYHAAPAEQEPEKSFT